MQILKSLYRMLTKIVLTKMYLKFMKVFFLCSIFAPSLQNLIQWLIELCIKKTVYIIYVSLFVSYVWTNEYIKTNCEHLNSYFQQQNKIDHEFQKKKKRSNNKLQFMRVLSWDLLLCVCLHDQLLKSYGHWEEEEGKEAGFCQVVTLEMWWYTYLLRGIQSFKSKPREPPELWLHSSGLIKRAVYRKLCITANSLIFRQDSFKLLCQGLWTFCNRNG